MRIYLHIGPESCGAERIQQVLDDKRDNLLGRGVLVPNCLGGRNHTRLFMAMTDPEHVDLLRCNRGFITAQKQGLLRDKLTTELQNEIARTAPHTMIITAAQLAGALTSPTELHRLKELLNRHSTDIRIVAWVQEQSQVLARHYARQVLEGRTASLATELNLAGTEDWWHERFNDLMAQEPFRALFGRLHMAPESRPLSRAAALHLIGHATRARTQSG
jgi:hypothetical protein